MGAEEELPVLVGEEATAAVKEAVAVGRANLGPGGEEELLKEAAGLEAQFVAEHGARGVAEWLVESGTAEAVAEKWARKREGQDREGNLERAPVVEEVEDKKRKLGEEVVLVLLGPRINYRRKMGVLRGSGGHTLQVAQVIPKGPSLGIGNLRLHAGGGC